MFDLQPNHYELWMRNVGPLLKSVKASLKEQGAQATFMDAPHRPNGAAIWAAAIALQVERALERVTQWSAILDQPEVEEIRQLLMSLYAPVAKTQVKAGDWTSVVQAEAMVQLMLVAHTALFKKHGQQSYVVADGLAQRLLETELRGLTADDLRLPHPSSYIEVPATLGLRIYHPIDGWKPLRAAYLYESENEAGVDGEPPHRRWFLLFVGGEKLDGVTDYFLSSSIGMLEGASLESCLSKSLERMLIAGMNAEVQAEWLRVFTWLMNVIVYTTWPDAERENVIASADARRLLNRLERAPKGHPRRRAILDQLKATEPRTRTILGQHVIPLERHAITSGRISSTGAPLVVRTLVQGHWRRLEPGEGKPWKVQKLLWIEPFWRGPQDGPTHSATTHEVKG